MTARPTDQRRRDPIPGEIQCPQCKGSGKEWLLYGGNDGMGGFHRCETCQGFGVDVTATFHVGDVIEVMGKLPDSEKCGTCNGKGVVATNEFDYQWEPCPTCHGSGKVKKPT